jgi:hypothetical protein
VAVQDKVLDPPGTTCVGLAGFRSSLLIYLL